MSLDPRSPFSTYHPLAGKITAGVKTTANRPTSATRHNSMQLQEMPTITMADRAQQMFSMDDKKGTRVYYANQGVFNTVDERGSSINFIGGLFKTTDRHVIRFLQQFVEKGHIQYLELQEDASDARPELQVRDEHERSQGSTGSPERPIQPDKPEPKLRLTASAGSGDRPEPGGEPEQDEQPSNRPAERREPGDGDDSQEPGRQDNQERPGEPPVEGEIPVRKSAMDLLRKGK